MCDAKIKQTTVIVNAMQVRPVTGEVETLVVGRMPNILVDRHGQRDAVFLAVGLSVVENCMKCEGAGQKAQDSG